MLYIRIKDGQPFEHPILGGNFRQAFPSVDTNNLPPEFARFERIEPPTPGVYEVYEGVTYEWIGGIVKDVHHIRQMTEQEKQATQDAVKAAWAEKGFASWMFDEETCSFKPPVPYPDDVKMYRWDEATTSWVEVITQP
jgi:hypothetical protein